MKTKFLFEYKIVVIMILMMTLLTTIGLYTFNRFSNIITRLSEEARPDMKLIYVKTLITDITDAENQAKSYCLTKDSTYLFQFYTSEEVVNDKLYEIGTNFNLNEEDKVLIDSLCNLINDKMTFLNQLISMQEQFRVELALNKVAKKIEKVAVATVKSKPNENNKQNSEKFILFKRVKKQDKVDPSSSVDIEPKIELSKITTNINEIKKEEDLYNDSLVANERLLIEFDNKVTNDIRNLFSQYEILELEKIAIKAEEAEYQVERTNWFIAFFCVAIGILLLIMTIIILNYVKANTRFRIALKKAKKEAEELAKTKERFLANMSHEIRTPMNAIAGFSEQIAQGPLTSEQRHQMSLVQKSTQHLLYIINDILDYSKLQNGKLKLEKVSFNIYLELEDLHQLILPISKEKNIEILLKIDASVPTFIKGDPFRLRQILLNILNNAIKFTSKGSINIEVSPTMLNENGLNLLLEITDSGVGMTQEQLSKVFLEFEQAEVSTTRLYGGTGLGLTITKKLIDLFEGSINIKSDIEIGTTVIIEIPFEIGNELDLIDSNEIKRIDHKLLKNLKILIVDDEPYNRFLLAAILKKYHITFTECENGKKAFEEIKRNNYDLILMDMRMPEWNGVESTKKIRALKDNRKNNIPIVAISAAVTEDDKLIYFKSGMNGFLPKPFSENELILEVQRVLQIEQTDTEIENGLNINEFDSYKHINLNELFDLSAGDNKFYAEMLDTYIFSTKEDFSHLKKAFLEKDYHKMANYAHKISAPSRHIGALKLYQNLKKIEHDCRNNKIEELNDLYLDCEYEIDEIIKEIYKEINLINHIINKQAI